LPVKGKNFEGRAVAEEGEGLPVGDGDAILETKDKNNRTTISGSKAIGSIFRGARIK